MGATRPMTDGARSLPSFRAIPGCIKRGLATNRAESHPRVSKLNSHQVSKNSKKSVRMAQFQKGDMSPELKQDVLSLVNQVCAEYKDDDGIASNLKKKLDAELTPTWQVTVGRNYASYVTHEKSTFGYFQSGPYAILVYKAGL